MPTKDDGGQQHEPELEIRKTIVIDASPEVVFKAISDPKELTNWFPDQAILEPRVGGSKSQCSQSEWRISGYQDNYCTIKRVRRIFSGYQSTGGTDKCLMLLGVAQFLFSNCH
jgi:uncharacterized protein YndB with AHSA1/START domain